MKSENNLWIEELWGKGGKEKVQENESFQVNIFNNNNKSS